MTQGAGGSLWWEQLGSLADLGVALIRVQPCTLIVYLLSEPLLPSFGFVHSAVPGVLSGGKAKPNGIWSSAPQNIPLALNGDEYKLRVVQSWYRRKRLLNYKWSLGEKKAFPRSCCPPFLKEDMSDGQKEAQSYRHSCFHSVTLPPLYSRP